MELNGFVQNGVVVLTGGVSLPEGTPVTVMCGEGVTVQRRVQVPLVQTGEPGSAKITNERIAEILDEEDIEYARKFMGEPPYDDSPWTEEERDAIRSEALDELGWEGMEAYQDDDK
jgi:hypothetical protein